MYNNSEFCYYYSIVIKNRIPINYSLDNEQTSYDDLFSDHAFIAIIIFNYWFMALVTLFHF
jgi:hypothetical protein